MSASRLVRESKQAADAVLGDNVPHFLTGLSASEIAALRSALPGDESPEGKEAAEIERALKICEGSIASATSMIAQRAGLRRGNDGLGND